jgi:hypothetical protein
VSQDDFSRPEVEQRYRNLQAHMVQRLTTEERLMPQPEPDPDPESERQPEPKFEAELQVAQSFESLSLGYQTDAPPTAVIVHALNNGSFRMRARKQSHPERSPFFYNLCCSRKENKSVVTRKMLKPCHDC